MGDAILIELDTTTGAIIVADPNGNEETEMKIATLMGEIVSAIIEEDTGQKPAFRVLPLEVVQELEQLRAEAKQLRRVLKPFAGDWLSYIEGENESYQDFFVRNCDFDALADSCERAYKALGSPAQGAGDTVEG